ncbi:hypothetical protein [Fontivita pretiosa]|uniref:hypothetical protein n=1 Tax=Fontivita pretiosa TaxID=2989684 RepID=UPI003D17CBEF
MGARDLASLAHLVTVHGVSFHELRHIAHRAGVAPALRLNGVEYFSREAQRRILQAVAEQRARQFPSPAASRQKGDLP